MGIVKRSDKSTPLTWEEMDNNLQYLYDQTNISFKNGLNSVGATATIGTSNNFALSLYANSVLAVTINTDGNLSLANNMYMTGYDKVIYGGPVNSNYINMYNSGTGQIDLKGLGTTGVRVKGKLVVENDISFSGSFLLNGSGNSSISLYDGATGNLQIKATSNTLAASKISFLTGTASIQRMVIGGDGNIGIGTTSPISPLEIKGLNGGANAGLVTITDTTALASGVGGSILFKGIYTGTAQTQSGLVRCEKVNATDGDYGFNLAFYNRTNGVGNFGAAKMIVLSNGNVGIGTINPTGKLHVYGASTNTVLFEAAGTYAEFGLKSPTGVWYQGTGFSSAGTASNFYLQAPGGAIVKVVTQTGSVGIGTLVPSQLLDVNGTAQANQFKLSALNTAPVTATSTGVLGEIRIDASYVYVCTATNTWKRSAITTW